jgi:predicted nucleic acid-binding protein
LKRFVFDAGPFILLFTREKGSDVARRAVLKHEAGEIEISIHPNNLSEAYRVLSETKKTRPRLLEKDVDPRIVVRSAYATLNVVQDEMTTINLGTLKVKYRDKPWGDLSSAALALRLSDEERIPVVTLDEERHLKDLSEITTIEISDLKM